MADELSVKQRGILQFLEDFIAEHDYPPSIRDIQTGCDISSTSVVDYNLKRLEEKGFIRRDREVSRAIELLDGQGERRRRGGTVQVPVLGRIAAGIPLPVHPDQLADLMERAPIKGIFLTDLLLWPDSNTPEADLSSEHYLRARPENIGEFKLARTYGNGSLLYVRQELLQLDDGK